MQGCCSQDCVDVIHLPEEEQKTIRRGVKNGNKIFKKGKSDVLTFKNREANLDPLAGVPNLVDLTKSKALAKKQPKIKKQFIGSGTHFYPKPSIGQFSIEENEIKVGDTILIKGQTTGEQQLVITEMLVNDVKADTAIAGDICTFQLPFRIRLSDKLYKILE
jgi:UPF0176 protein